VEPTERTYLSMSGKITIALLLLGVCCSSVFAWGTEGHQIVATIAQRRLTRTAQQKVATMIGDRTFASIAMIPDTYRNYDQGKWSADCHFINAPSPAAETISMKDCPSYCVVKSVQNYTKLMTGESNSPKVCNFSVGVEPCSLVFMIHFVGDVHQPMHAGYATDRGGNSVNVKFFGKATNLHSLWDSGILDKWGKGVNNAVAFLEELATSDPALVKMFESNMDPMSWGSESFADVKKVCYDFGSKDPVPDLGDAYYARALPIVQRRLLAAAVRLAKLVNSVLDK